MALLSEQQQKHIQQETRELLKKFSAMLNSVKMPVLKHEASEGGFRPEGAGIKSDEYFRRGIFANAPEKDDDYLITERKTW